MKFALLYSILLFSYSLNAQTTYTGFIDKYPVELCTDIYSDGHARAVYCYTKFDEPILLNGNLSNGLLEWFEEDKTKKKTAVMRFKNAVPEADSLAGTWTDLKSGKQLAVSLHKTLQLIPKDSGLVTEILQPVSLPNTYFKLEIPVDENSITSFVSGVNLYEKKTDKLIQHFGVECQLWGLENISVDDYNFDGYPDFSVFEQSFAGPNTSSIYFLYDPKTKVYFQSEFSGVSLEFDPKTKTITERNQCCAGTSVTITTYKVVKNKMVLIAQKCFKWSEKKGELVERKWQECE